MAELNQPSQEPIAIVGIGCRFPGGADDASSFWSLLSERRCGIREVPADRWSLDRFYHPDAAVAGGMVMRRGGFLGNLTGFDAGFWSISPREAVRMDPQQRWLLEVAWEALEDAGIPPFRLRGRTVGVFVGISSNDYGGLQLRSTEDVDAYTNSGNTASIASNRISYLLDLKGPSISIDTACSSSLVAVSAACDSIWSRQCEGALAGGVNALISPQTSVGFSKAGMISPTGECFAYDARANGFVRAEGAALVYLKPLSAALADGDRIYAVVRAGVVNQDGHTSSMTVPSATGQAAMLSEAYRLAGIAPDQVVYVEAHGTGTPVGDPIEAAALGRVLGRGRTRSNCLIGSVKPNIGHLESAAGIAGFIKAALVLHHRAIPATLNFETPNPEIPFADLRLQVVSCHQPLPDGGSIPPVVGVNSFGFGGTNAHVVLQAAPERAATLATVPFRDERPFLLPISARDDTALRDYVRLYRELLTDPSHRVADVCAAAGQRKEHHANRLVIVGATRQELRRRAAAWLRDGTPDGVIAGRPRTHTPPVFVFAGQGPQWFAMGRQLLDREPAFRTAIEDIDTRIQRLAGWSLLTEMGRPEAESIIDQTHIAQPALFALQVALVELWKTWGIEPAKVIGHSCGEVAAAFCAGVYSLDDAVRIITTRGRLQHATFGGGRMLVVALSADEARARIREGAGVEVAAINSSTLTTLAGDVEPLRALDEQLQRCGIFTRWLRGRYAFHSAQMDPVRNELLGALDAVDPQPERIPIVSTVTAAPVKGVAIDAAYWWHNVRQPVLFGPAVAHAIGDGDLTFLEVSPHPVLESSIKECLAEAATAGAVFHSLRRGTDESMEMATNLAGMHVLGSPVKWNVVNRGSDRLLPLPRYPWNRENYWIESTDSARVRLNPTGHTLLGQRIESAVPTWQVTLDLNRLSYLNDHRIWDAVVFPAAGYSEIGLALARVIASEEHQAVENLEILKALFLGENDRTILQTVFNPADKTFAVYSSGRGAAGWELHAQGALTPLTSKDAGRVDLESIRRRLGERLDHQEYCRELLERSYQFGPAFRQVQNIWRSRSEALVQIEPPPSIAESCAGYVFHPAVQDACFHALLGLPPREDARTLLYLPHSIERVHVRAKNCAGRLWSHAVVRTADASGLVADIHVYDDDGSRVADILGFRIEGVEQKEQGGELEQCYYRFDWVPRRLRASGIHGPCTYPSAGQIAERVAAALPEVQQRHGLEDYYGRFVPEAEATAMLIAQRAFTELGWTPHPGDRVELQAFMETLEIADDYRRVTRRLLRQLDSIGVLRSCEEDVWEVVSPPGRAIDIESALDRLEAAFPSEKAEIDLFRRVRLRLASVLSGESDPLELMFPGGSHEMMERFYSEALAFPAHLELTRLAIVTALASLPARRAIRVLEVGGGTGALTRVLQPILRAHKTEYLFTDIGLDFVAAAREQFGDVPFIDCQVLDLEADPQAQKIPAAYFDLIVAADAVHATSDVRRTLRNLQKCLAPAGLLLLLEVVKPQFVRDDVTFGLLKGYSQFTDIDLRPYSALLDQFRWEQVLRETGFNDVRAIACRESGTPEHAIIVGFAPTTQLQHREKVDSANSAACVLFADHGGVAESLADRLRERGDAVVMVRPGKEFRQPAPSEFVIRTDSEHDVARVLAEIGSPDPAAVIHCWSLDQQSADGMNPHDMRAAQETSVLSAFRLARTFAASSTRVCFVTRNAHSVVEGDLSGGLAASPLAGFTRVANNEYECRFSTVDIDTCAPDEAAGWLLDEVVLPSDGEFEIAYRNGVRHVARLQRMSLEEVPPRMLNAVGADGRIAPFRLQTNRPGILTNLALHETERCGPAPDEVEVRVHAAGINFRDLMKALGTYPGKPADLLWLGDDLSGTVERVGERVTHLRCGDRVVGMAPYAFQSYVNANARILFKIPTQLSFEEATTIPTVFLTAHYALKYLAQLRRGESILIHAGTGGVGQAAIQIAKYLGVKVFATAGTPEKRRMLVDMGVRHVSNSRTLDFADEILLATNGRGVDAVLNSLAGDFIAKSMSVLAPFGRFLEIGKVDIYRNSRIALYPLRNNISYFVIDLTQHLQDRQEFVIELFAEIGERFEAGDYTPITYRSFPITEAVDAFRYMAQGRHIGKNVLTFEQSIIPIAFSTDPEHRFKSEATYLVTGGAGGFGLEVASWIARHGGRHLVLMSRSGPRDSSSLKAIERLRSAGVSVVDARGDVSRPEDVARVVQQIEDTMPPLKGVFHAAMVLDDARISELDEQRVRQVLEPKMLGAWNLHVTTERLSLDHFVCFSSISAVIGVLRQSNYNAGNAFLDALAHYRRARGLPSLTINWGAILGAGFVERDKKTAETLERVGFGSFQKDEALRVLSRLLVADVSTVAAARVDWQAVLKLAPLAATSSTYAAVTSQTADAQNERSLLAQLRRVSAAEQERLLEMFIVSQIAGVFGTAEEKIDKSMRLTDVGLDSLMTLELTNRVERELGIRIPMGTLFSGPTIAQLARSVRQLVASALTAAAPGRTSAGAESEAHIVTIKTGTDVPVFCFHPVGGGVGIYSALSPHLPPDLPLYGVESRLVQGARDEYPTLGEMVDAYVAAVRTAHRGPYRLLGFSLGGYLAASAAERLETNGELVDFVGVIDWDARQKLTPDAQRESLVRLSVAAYLFLQEEMGILRARPEEQLRQEISGLVARVTSASGGGGDAFYNWVVEHQLTTSKAHDEAAREYFDRLERHCRLLAAGLSTPRFQAPLVVWRANGGFGSPLQSWGHDDASGREHVFEGDHNALMRPTALRLVAQQMIEVLEERRRTDVVAPFAAAHLG